MDLLINTSAATCAARLHSSFLLPCLGTGAFDDQPQTSLATPLELFVSPNNESVAYLQQRSPAALGQQQRYAHQLAQQLSQLRVSEV